jgi:hypothetical protein
MSSVFGILIAPLCGWILDYKVNRGLYKVYFLCNFILLFFFCQGYSQKMLNLSIIQTITWLMTLILCIVCMFRSIGAAIAAIVIFIFSRTMLVTGCQAVIAIT